MRYCPRQKTPVPRGLILRVQFPDYVLVSDRFY